MKLPATALDEATLSAAVQKALAPGPAQLMVARGVMPLPPGDLASALYQLTFAGDSQIAPVAAATAADLPERVMAAALADSALDPRVLDWLAEQVSGHPALISALVGNASVADETLAGLAARGTADEIDRLATNEQRMLRHPEIIAAMYLNPRARMSTVDRAVELAVRNRIRVPGLNAWDEIARVIGGGEGAVADPPEDDDTFAAVVASATDPEDETVKRETPAEEVSGPINQLSIKKKMRLASMGNRFARSILVRDPLKMVALAAIKAPGVNESEVVQYAKNPALCEDVVRYIATRGDWTKNSNVKFALIMNPKNSLASSMQQLPALRPAELKAVLMSKGIPSALVQQAKRLMSARSGGGKK